MKFNCLHRMRKTAAQLSLLSAICVLSLPGWSDTHNQNPCIDIIKLTPSEIEEKLELSSDELKAYKRIDVSRTRLKSQRCYDALFERLKKEKEPFISRRQVELYRRPVLLNGELCKIEFTGRYNLDAQWRNPEYSQRKYFVRVGRSQTECENQPIESYVYLPKDIPDAQVLSILKYVNTIASEVSRQAGVPVDNLVVRELGVKVLPSAESYYELVFENRDVPSRVSVIFEYGEKENVNIIDIRS